MDKSHCRRFVISSGINFHKKRDVSTGQKVNAVSKDDAEKIIRLRSVQGYGNSNAVKDEKGWFYIIQVIPEYNPNRIKFGYASDIQSRLSAHRCSAPTAEVVATFPCDPAWEKVAIMCCAKGQKQIGCEVFDVDDVRAVVEKARRFMELMNE
jgi:hypothetical protein